MLLMYKDIELAVENGNGDFALFSNIDIGLYPPMQYWFRDYTLTKKRFLLFLEDRFPPSSRESSHKMCETLGIAYPDQMKFLEITRGCTPMDDVWVKLKPEDKYDDFKVRS